MRIRLTITNVEPGSPVGDAVSTVVPVGATISIIKKATTGYNMAVGHASMEIELVDLLSGVRLAVSIDRRESGKWTAIEEAFEYWA